MKSSENSPLVAQLPRLAEIIALMLLPIAAAHAQTSIPAGSTRYDADTPGIYNLDNGVTRSLTSGSNEAIRIANTGTAGTYTLNINGTVSQTSTGANVGRGIRTSVANVTFSISIGSTGFVQSSGDDAVQGRGGLFNLTNLGTLYGGPNFAATPTTPLLTGRGLNLRDATGGGTITNGSINNATALIRSDGGDAVRVGSNFAFTNYGTLNAAGVVNDASSNNVFNASPNNNVSTTYAAGAGFSFEDIDVNTGAANSSLSNFGIISGARHAVQAGTAGTGLTVTNNAGGQIIGRNGSGVGLDTLATDPTKIVVNNYGLIRGDYAGVGNIIDRAGTASPTNDGDGDGVDIDGAANIHNYSTGQILATGAGGFDSGGRANASEGISIGGGNVINDGVIRGANHGIIVNNDSRPSRSGDIATTVTNNANATIEGQNGFAIRMENKYGDARDNDTIVNNGTIVATGAIPNPANTVTIQDGTTDTNSTGTLDGMTYNATGSARFIRGDGSAIQMGEGADVLTNSGTITGNNGRAISMEGGDDTVNLLAGTVSGSINGGVGTNTLNLGNGVSHSDAIMSFQNINVASGSATISGAISGTTLAKDGAGALILSGANTYTGDTTVSLGTLRVNNTTGSATGAGNVMLADGATLAGAGTIAGNVAAIGILAPGNSIGNLTINGDVTWNGTLADAWQFELGSGNTSDRLAVGHDFLKGSGNTFSFNFLGSTQTGTFTLVSWANTTTFSATNFAFQNLGAGRSGSFAIQGNQLQFTVVPEPSASTTILVGSLALLATLRRRQRHGA